MGMVLRFPTLALDSFVAELGFVLPFARILWAGTCCAFLTVIVPFPSPRGRFGPVTGAETPLAPFRARSSSRSSISLVTKWSTPTAAVFPSWRKRACILARAVVPTRHEAVNARRIFEERHAAQDLFFFRGVILHSFRPRTHTK